MEPGSATAMNNLFSWDLFGDKNIFNACKDPAAAPLAARPRTSICGKRISQWPLNPGGIALARLKSLYNYAQGVATPHQ